MNGGRTDGRPDRRAGAASWTASTRLLLGVWIAATLLYGLADGATTVLLYATPGTSELNPLVGAAYATAGSGGVAALKVAALACCLAISLHAGSAGDRWFPVAVPSLLAVLGGGPAAYNLQMLL